MGDNTDDGEVSNSPPGGSIDWTQFLSTLEAKAMLIEPKTEGGKTSNTSDALLKLVRTAILPNFEKVLNGEAEPNLTDELYSVLRNFAQELAEQVGRTKDESRVSGFRIHIDEKALAVAIVLQALAEDFCRLARMERKTRDKVGD